MLSSLIEQSPAAGAELPVVAAAGAELLTEGGDEPELPGVGQPLTPSQYLESAQYLAPKQWLSLVHLLLSLISQD